MSETLSSTPMHDKYYGTTKKAATAELPVYLEDALKTPVETDKSERKALSKEARLNSWDELDLTTVFQTRTGYDQEMASYNAMLQHPDVPVTDPTKALNTRASERAAAIAANMVPIPEGTTGAELRALKARRNQVIRMMRMDINDFIDLSERWARHETIQLADERSRIEAAADREDSKDHMAGPEMRKARAEMAELDKKHGGKLKNVGRMPHLEVTLDSGDTAEVDPVSAFNRYWAEVKGDKARFAATLEAVTNQGHDEAWLRANYAEKFFLDNLADSQTDAYDSKVGRKLFRNRDKFIQKLVGQDLKTFVDIAVSDEASKDFVKYANRQRKYELFKTSRDHVMDVLRHGSVITASELKMHKARHDDLRAVRGMSSAEYEQLSPEDKKKHDAQMREYDDLSLILEDVQHGRVGHQESADGTEVDPGKRNTGINEAWLRTLARLRMSHRALEGQSVNHTKKLKTAVYSAAVLRSTGDLGWETLKATGRNTRKLGKWLLDKTSRGGNSGTGTPARQVAPTHLYNQRRR